MIPGECSHSVGSSSGDIWLTANIRCVYTYLVGSLPLWLEKTNPNDFHACKLRFFSWIDDFSGFVLGLTPALSGSVHGHISTAALWGPDVLRLCVCFSCLRGSSALLCFSLRMAFPSAAGSAGVLLYPLRCCSSLFAGKQQLCPLRKRAAHWCLSVALLRKTPVRLPPINICIFMSMTAGASGRY